MMILGPWVNRPHHSQANRWKWIRSLVKAPAKFCSRATHGGNSQLAWQSTLPMPCRLIECQMVADLSSTSPRTNLFFPLDETFTLRVNASSEELDGYVTGSLTVDMNPKGDSSNAVLVANARYSNFQLFNATSICLKQVSNTTQIMIDVRIARSSMGSFMKSDRHVFRYPRGRGILLIP